MSTVANWPVSVSAEPASTSPISIEPESPMKIRAGKKLCGRKPTQAPPSAAQSSAAVIARVSPLASASL